MYPKTPHFPSPGSPLTMIVARPLFMMIGHQSRYTAKHRYKLLLDFLKIWRKSLKVGSGEINIQLISLYGASPVA